MLSIPGGFCIVPNFLVRDESISPMAKMVYVALASCARQGICSYSHEFIGTIIHREEQTVANAINKELVPTGWVTVISVGHHHLPSRYRVLTSCHPQSSQGPKSLPPSESQGPKILGPSESQGGSDLPPKSPNGLPPKQYGVLRTPAVLLAADSEENEWNDFCQDNEIA